jgi:hypothetical protein
MKAANKTAIWRRRMKVMATQDHQYRKNPIAPWSHCNAAA